MIRLLWITDPWKTLDHASDTTLRLIQESLALKFESHWADVRTLRLEFGEARLATNRVVDVDQPIGPHAVRFGSVQHSLVSEFSHVFYRVDPPIDLAYTLPIQILAQAATERSPRFVNPISVLLQFNEKFEPAKLSQLFPDSFVSSEISSLIRFISTQKKTVLKPLFQAQSKGVRVIEALESNSKKTVKYLKDLTHDETIPVIAQKYLPGILKGEKRLWFSGGRLIACVQKVPRAGESIIDMDHGGSIRTTTLNASEKRAALAIGRHLQANDICWAAVDLIDGMITDFNFTSPGLIVQMEKLLGRNLAKILLQDAVSI